MTYNLLAESGSTLGEIMKKAVLPDDVSFFGIPVNQFFFIGDLTDIPSYRE